MQDNHQEAEEFGGRTVPPATPPLINDNASAEEAALQAGPGGDSDFPGQNPDEVKPGKGDFDRPASSPEQEVPGQGGDTDSPGSTPAETPAQPDMPSEAPAPD